MKTCPICNAVAFDDAEVCFGCMHRYGDQETEPKPPEPIAGDDASPILPDTPPAFFIRMIPVLEQSGGVTWSCSVELQ